MSLRVLTHEWHLDSSVLVEQLISYYWSTLLTITPQRCLQSSNDFNFDPDLFPKYDQQDLCVAGRGGLQTNAGQTQNEFLQLHGATQLQSAQKLLCMWNVSRQMGRPSLLFALPRHKL